MFFQQKKIPTRFHRRKFSILTAGFVLAQSCPLLFAQVSEATPSAAEIDWRPLDELSPEQQALVPEACCGRYVEEVIPRPEGDPQTTYLRAGILDSNEEEQAVIMEHKVRILQEGRLIESEHGQYNMETEQATLSGGVKIRQAGLLLTGSDASIDRSSGRSLINNASYLFHEESVRGSADVIVYTSNDGSITIDNGVYTRCEPGNNTWQVEAGEITLDQQAGRGTARHVTLRVKDVPILYTPYLSFPINDQRKSGFLAPVLGSTRDGGMDIATPYYFNLAPNYDATLTPRLLTDRGLQMGLEARHRGRRSENQVNMTYLGGDNLYDPALAGDLSSDSPPTADRWLLDLDHFAVLSDRWYTQAQYNAVSDIDYFQDFGSTGLNLNSQSFLSRSVRLNYLGRHWRFSSSALGFQIIDPNVSPLSKPYDRLPRLQLDGRFYLGDSLEYGLNTEYVAFDRDIPRHRLSQAQIDAGALVTGQRLSVTPAVSWRWGNQGIFLKPSFKYKYSRYDLEDQALGTEAQPNRDIFIGSLDGGLIFERPLTLGDRDFAQTLEPRLFYLYSEYEDQSQLPLFDSTDMTFSYNQLFREDRFSGGDRIGDSDQLTLALSSRLLDAAGREKASASVGQIFYFKDRRVTLRREPGQEQRRASSSIAAEFAYQLNDHWRLNSYLEWNTGDNTLDVGNFQFRYQSDINHILNFSYRYRDVENPITPTGLDRRINQTDISGIWPLGENWALIGRWNYDHGNQRNLEAIAGFEYKSCCWNVRLIAREWIDSNALFHGVIDDNRGIFLQFELKGFGSVLGGNVNSLLNNGIAGYREREYDE